MENHLSTQLTVIAPSNLHQLTEDFTDRSQILKKIDDWLKQKERRFFILVREPRVGKSAIAPYLA
jgi:hypothetical protein